MVEPRRFCPVCELLQGNQSQPGPLNIPEPCENHKLNSLGDRSDFLWSMGFAAPISELVRQVADIADLSGEDNPLVLWRVVAEDGSFRPIYGRLAGVDRIMLSGGDRSGALCINLKVPPRSLASVERSIDADREAGSSR